MRTDMGFFDRLFGGKATIQLPQQDGSTRTVRVSIKWLEEMERLGKISTVMSQSIKVHVLDPRGGLGQELASQYALPPEMLEDLGMSTAAEKYRVEAWKVGVEISAGDYFKFRDQHTDALYVLLEYQAGKPNVRILPRDLWVQARHELGE